jgi:hypothetical protein
MTNGVVSIVVDGSVRWKIITGHDGEAAPAMANLIREFILEKRKIPDRDDLLCFVSATDFGSPKTVVILEKAPLPQRAIVHSTDPDWDYDNPEYQRYTDTFDVPQFNPRWKYGTAPYVEVIDILTVKE